MLDFLNPASHEQRLQAVVIMVKLVHVQLQLVQSNTIHHGARLHKKNTCVLIIFS
jgi:hypothetical protein